MFDGDTVRAVLISTEGRNFSVGGELRSMASAEDHRREPTFRGE